MFEKGISGYAVLPAADQIQLVVVIAVLINLPDLTAILASIAP